MSIPVVECYNGVFLPLISLGTYGMHNGQGTIEPALKSAVQLGYHSVDTAQFYDNEHDLGAAVQKYGTTHEGEFRVDKTGLHYAKFITEAEWAANRAIPHGAEGQSRLLVTTKVWPTSYEPAQIDAHINQHLKDFGTDCGGLILLHWPALPAPFSKGEKKSVGDNKTIRHLAWRTLERAYHDKKFRGIGVSNFMLPHLEPLIEDILERKEAGDRYATLPVCNQCECSPLLDWDPKLFSLMSKYGIIGTAYSPLCQNRPDLHANSTMKAVAEKYGVPVSAVALRFVLQTGICVLPKSASEKNQKANLEAFGFALEPADMTSLKSLQIQNRKRFCPDPFDLS